MNRRSFLKGLSLATIFALYPQALNADMSQVEFNEDVFSKNNAQTIMIFLYGGPSELGANLTNIEEIQLHSQKKYTMSDLRITENGFWEQAGGDLLEDMLANGDLNLFRTCFRKSNTTKSHENCVSENQRGIMNEDLPMQASGIFATLGRVLAEKGKIDPDTTLPFITMEGESGFFYAGGDEIQSMLRPVAIDEKLTNPYQRVLSSRFYTGEELDEDVRVNDSNLSMRFDNIAKSINKNSSLQEVFDKRKELESFITSQEDQVLPDGISYPETTFAKKIQTAINILVGNNDTKIISLGSAGLGGWDDHSDAVSAYTNRMKDLIKAIQAGVTHLNTISNTNINIMVFGDFGRNVNLNDSLGWDHGNNQNLYIFGGKNYFNHVGVVGKTQLMPLQGNNRIYLEPTPESYTFEPYSIASTIYKLYGISNPEVLTGGFKEIEAGLLK